MTFSNRVLRVSASLMLLSISSHPHAFASEGQFTRDLNDAVHESGIFEVVNTARTNTNKTSPPLAPDFLELLKKNVASVSDTQIDPPANDKLHTVDKHGGAIPDDQLLPSMLVKPPIPPTQPRHLVGYIADDIDKAKARLRRHDSEFFELLKAQTAKVEKNRQPDKHHSGFLEFIEDGQFFGNPVLIRLDPPFESDASSQLNTAIANAEQAQKDVTAIEQAISDHDSQAKPDTEIARSFALSGTVDSHPVNLKFNGTENQNAHIDADSNTPNKQSALLGSNEYKEALKLAEDLVSKKQKLYNSTNNRENAKELDQAIRDLQNLKANQEEKSGENTLTEDMNNAREAVIKATSDYRTSVFPHRRDAARKLDASLTKYQSFQKKAALMGKPGENEIALVGKLEQDNIRTVREHFLQAPSRELAHELDDAITNYNSLKKNAESLEVRRIVRVILERRLAASLQHLGEALGELKTSRDDENAAHQDTSKQLIRLRRAQVQLRQSTDANAKSLKEEIAECSEAISRTRPLKYLLVMNYNIPAVKPGIFPPEYLFARFTAQPMLRSVEWDHTIHPKSENETECDSDSLRTQLNYDPLRVTAIYPKNQPLSASKSNSQTWDATIQPSWNGFSAGSLEYTAQDQLNYNVTFPKVVGLGAESGNMEWTYYPAKAQRITFGTQMAFAVISVPALLSDAVLQLNAKLNYRYKYAKIFPADAGQQVVSSFAALPTALHSTRDIEIFRRTVLRSMGTDDQKAIERLLRHDDPLQLFMSSTDSTDNAIKSANATSVGKGKGNIKPFPEKTKKK